MTAGVREAVAGKDGEHTRAVTSFLSTWTSIELSQQQREALQVL